MPCDPAGCSWLSAHLFFKGHSYSPECDQVLLEVVEPFVRLCRRQNWVERYFFVRYAEHGHHVRLRLYGATDILAYGVKPALRQHIRAVLPEALRGYPSAALPDRDEPLEKERSLHWVAYVPEVERYGGEEGVALAERFFDYSSEACLALLKQCTRKARSVRLAKGLLMMLLTLHAFLPSRGQAAGFCFRYTTGYLRQLIRDEAQEAAWLEAFKQGYGQQAEILIAYIDTVWESLEAATALSETLDRYTADLREVSKAFEALWSERRLLQGATVLEDWTESVQAIVPSYIHMTNNRLGISIVEESYLGYLITRALPTSDVLVVAKTS